LIDCSLKMISQEIASIRVHPKAHSAIIGGHPWVIRDSLTIPPEPIELGAQVMLVSPDGKPIARGLYHPTSRIAVRVYSRDARQVLDEAFFIQRLDRALKLRELPLFSDKRGAARLVFSEGDSLSGLIVDRYASHLVVQQTAAVLTPFIPKIIEHLQQRYTPDSIRWMVDDGVAKLEGLESKNVCEYGVAPETPVPIVENGLDWQVDLVTGQKTGYYLDQRDNRAAVAKWLPENANVLDVCCYEGGFALTVAAHRHDCSVLGLDSSLRAIASAENNAKRNQITNVNFQEGDFIKTLQSWNSLNSDLREAPIPTAPKYEFDCVILDPPKLAGSRDSIDRAMRAYHRLNFLAVGLLKPGGILVTCSCSGRVSHEDFQWMLRGVARQARRSVQILERRGAAPDHPVNAACPESDYLKCYICRIGDVESSKAV
jgi:23S rRNA (cytosine1962-C5)-methyltransferase